MPGQRFFRVGLIGMLVFGFASVAWGAPPKNAEEILEKGKEKHAETCEKIDQDIRKDLEKQLKTARKNGNREHLEKIQGWQADFEQHKKVPRELSNFKVRRWNAHKELVQAYQEAIQSATKKGDDSLAKDWDESLKDFMESIDPFDQSSVWKGKVLVKPSDKKSKPYEGPVSCKILHRSLDHFKVEVNHSHERQWHIEFALEDNVWHAKKLVLTKVQNHFGDPLGPREIFSNRVNFDGSTWTIEVTRKENQGKVQVKYQVQQE